MAVPVQLESLPFDPSDAKAALNQLPTSAAVFALYGAEAHAEPYIGRTPNLRARLARLLQPSAKHPRRLQLAGLVRQIRWRLTGSEFEALLVQFELLEKVHGAKSLERMHLRAPAFVRYLGTNAYPRITVTHRPSQREGDWAYGPFPSRAAAERFVDEALKLFLLRRCTEELAPRPDHPGCVYSEMKMCLAPCYQGCTDERYAEEAAGVERFLATRGESRLVLLRNQRDEASANLEFEAAAALHAQVQRVEGVRALAPELVRPLAQLRAVVLQASAFPGEVAVFLYENGRLTGPQGFSTLGMRIQNEQSGSTSLFAQPMVVEAIAEEAGSREQGTGNRDEGRGTRDQGVEISTAETGPTAAAETVKGTGFSPYIHADREAGAFEAAKNLDSSSFVSGHDLSRAANGPTHDGALASEGTEGDGGFIPRAEPIESATALAAEERLSAKLARGLLEARMEAVLAALAEAAVTPSTTDRQGHLALLKRWYYRPEIRRSGEIFFPGEDGCWPVKALLRGVGRVVASGFKAPTAE